MENRDKENQGEELEAFKESYIQNLRDLLDTPELFAEMPISPDPYSMGIDERTPEELSPEELRVIRQTLFDELGVDTQKEDSVVRTYSTLEPSEEGEEGLSDTESQTGRQIQVTVYKTNREKVFVQELLFSSEEKRWVIGPDQDI